MSGETFVKWLSEVRAAGLAKSDATAARLLGRTPDWAARAKKNGTDLVTALACRAVLHRMEPYS